MKKIFGLIAALILIIGCDDGEMGFNSFNFENGTLARCADSNIYYKINGTEVLMLDLSANNLVNVASPLDGNGNKIPTQIPIGAGNTITYRNYDSAPAANSICSFPAPASPVVTEEWSGEGTITVVTDVLRNNDGIITGYSHKITLQDISFTKNGETTRIVNNDFGSIIIPIGFTFNFGTEEINLKAKKCPENNLVFRRNAQEALLLDFVPGTFPATLGGEPVEINFENLTDENDMIFLVYDGSITDAHICDVISPVSPNIRERWSATSGRAVITSVPTPGGSGVDHQIRLYDVVFTKESDASGQTFAISDLVLPDTENPEYFYFGYYQAE